VVASQPVVHHASRITSPQGARAKSIVLKGWHDGKRGTACHPAVCRPGLPSVKPILSEPGARRSRVRHMGREFAYQLLRIAVAPSPAVTLLPRNAVRRPRLVVTHQPSSFDLAPGTAPELTGGYGLGELPLRTQMPVSHLRGFHLILSHPPIPESVIPSTCTV